MSDLYTRLIMLERDNNEMRRRISSLESSIVGLTQNNRIAGMTSMIGSGGGSDIGLGWAKTNVAIASNASGSILLLDESKTSTGVSVTAYNGYSFTIPISRIVQYRKTSSGNYVILVIDCTL